MGERLNLEIKSQGKAKANAYYHWSGYTSSSYYIAKEAVASIDRIKVKDPILKAIRILEATGAGLPQHEKEEMKQQEMKAYLTVNDTLNSSIFFNFKDGSTAEFKNAKDLQDFLDQVNNWKVYKEMLQTLKNDLAYLDECLFLDEDTDPEDIIKHANRELTEIRYKLRKCLEGE